METNTQTKKPHCFLEVVIQKVKLMTNKKAIDNLYYNAIYLFFNILNNIKISSKRLKLFEEST